MNEQPIAANRNDANTVSAVGDPSDDLSSGPSSGPSSDPSSGSLLVVECRRDDRWRVELCTDLSELDGALDMARALRSAADVDEVCLTLEVSGTHGRESRREVLRFTPEMAAHARTRDPMPINTSPVGVSAGTNAAVDTGAVGTEAIGPEAIAVLHASLKVPDYCLDDLDFSQFALPEQPSVPADERPEMTVDADDVRLHFGQDPVVISDSGPTEEQSRTAARTLLASLYSAKPDSFGDENAIHVSLPPTDNSDWLDRTERPSGFPSARHHRLEADGEEEDDSDDAVVRLESPLLGRHTALASKLLVFAGAVALLVLGGAVAELLAVDLTTAANAGVGPFDTLATLQGDISR